MQRVLKLRIFFSVKYHSDNSSLSAVISMAQAVPDIFCKKVFQKHQVNWNTVCGAMQNLQS